MSYFLHGIETNDLYEEKYQYQNTFPLMSTPVPLLSILATYLFFILKLGPYLMAKRKPYDLRALIVVYNFAMVLYNTVLAAWPFVGGQLSFVLAKFCRLKEVDDAELMENTILYGWCFFFSKIVELADTVFFVLRKKQRQISFLHVFHHVGISLLIWFHNKYIPGPQALAAAMLNSSVHIFMYTYYMLAAMGPEYQKYTWWKKYMTWIQLVQFIIMFFYTSALLLFGCDEPPITSMFFLFFSVVFLSLFANFYYKTYMNKSKDS